MKVKVYSIFGATSEIKNRPYDTGIVIKKDIECRPCQYDKRWNRCKNWECMNIKPAEVMGIIIDKDEINFELGVIISTYKRYDYLVCTLSSILNSDLNNENVKICITDDGSQEIRVSNLIINFRNSFKGKVINIIHLENWGKLKYWKTLNIAVAIKAPIPININEYNFEERRVLIKIRKMRKITVIANIETKVKLIMFLEKKSNFLSRS